jgi:hypothetical protein
MSKIVHESMAESALFEKHLLRELYAYLEGLLTMQNQRSNMVYVVSLGTDRPHWSSLSWKEFVTQKEVYFHPFGSGSWPKMPPNYLGFRYSDKLQSIHHIDSYKIVTDLREMTAYIPEIDGEKWANEDDTPHYLYYLGPAIRPGHDVRTGKPYRSTRVWAALDLLLTCDTISEARDLTQKRLHEVEEFDAR